jgi:PII-like signaling protein
MQAICIRFYVQEGGKHGHLPVHEWLFKQARDIGISGGTVFRAAAGFGRHGLQEDTFFELAGKLPESIEFFADEGNIEALLQRVGVAGLKLVYVVHPVSIGITGDGLVL